MEKKVKLGFKCWQLIIVISFFVAIPLTAQATLVNFDSLVQLGYKDYAPIPDGYGSTADVTVSYKTLSSDLSTLYSYASLWTSGYADLTSAAYSKVSGAVLDITLTAKDPSKSVTLNSFQVAAYPKGTPDRSADLFQVVDGNGKVLVDYLQHSIGGTTATTLTPDVTAHSVSILLGYYWNNGINNIDFTAKPTPTPLPAAAWLLGSGVMGLFGLRRKRSNS